jgi:hypothetical protein
MKRSGSAASVGQLNFARSLSDTNGHEASDGSSDAGAVSAQHNSSRRKRATAAIPDNGLGAMRPDNGFAFASGLGPDRSTSLESIDNTPPTTGVRRAVVPAEEPATHDYFVQQTAQNLLRRLAVNPSFALSADHGFTGHEVVTWLLKVDDFTTRE